MDQLVRFGKWRYLNMEKSAVEKKFEFASTAIATRFEAQGEDFPPFVPAKVALTAIRPDFRSERRARSFAAIGTSIVRHFDTCNFCYYPYPEPC
jgi:hypothetical protein